MTQSRESAVVAHLRRSREAIERAAGDPAFVAATAAIGERVAGAFRNGNRLLLAGNGGSAADAQHLAAEFVGRFVSDRAPLPAIALTTDTSAITSIGNDYGFEQVFARQLKANGRANDVFVAISTSGRSPNILAALTAAREIGLTTVGFTGQAQNPMQALCDLVLAVPSEETALIQQLHITAGHAICALVERELFGSPPQA
jgi:D-sedoheptulose 7-phosphate isomerase